MPMLPPPLFHEQSAIIRTANHGAPTASVRPAPRFSGSTGPNDAPPPPPKVTVPDLTVQKPADLGPVNFQHKP